MSPAEWHNWEEYEADVDQFGYPEDKECVSEHCKEEES